MTGTLKNQMMRPKRKKGIRKRRKKLKRKNMMKRILKRLDYK